LAFAVAVAVSPDILIVDEALAVGDAAFQRKCFQKIERLRNSGTSLLFVSHDLDSVKRVCDRAILLSHGGLVANGSAKQVCDLYEKSTSESLGSSRDYDESSIPTSNGAIISAVSCERTYGDGCATIESVTIQNEQGELLNAISEKEAFRVVYVVLFHAECDGVEFGMMLKTVEGIPVYGVNTIGSETPKRFGKSQKVEVVFQLQGNLLPGVYYLNVGATHKIACETSYLHRRVDCIVFRVSSSTQTQTIGTANLFASTKVQLKHEPFRESNGQST